ncbi:MAG: AAA family ATPase [Cellulosilyticaceae bacterium]
MKPIRLEMSAFGPYADQQILDFEVLEGRNIFLVTGVTGAGKTTIFDAISYALFGEASGSSREAASLRSHFASEDVMTYVDLTFEVRGERYQVIRSPEQEVLKKRGEGTTIKGAAVELILPKGEKPLTKVGEVQERIREIVGVDKDQFRQIVMLPQGEFRRLLESKSSDREAIFRKIFGTQAFQNIQLKLRERRNKLSEDLRLDRNSVSIYIQSLKAPEGHPLRQLQAQSDIDTNQVSECAVELVEADEQMIQEETKKLAELREKSDVRRQEVVLAKENNQKIDFAEQAKQRLVQHQALGEKVAQEQRVLELAKKALEVSRSDEVLGESTKQKDLRDEALQQAIRVEQTIQKQLEQVSAALRDAKEDEPKRQKLREEIAHLMPYKEKIQHYHQQVACVLALQEQLQALNQNKIGGEAQLQKDRQILEQLIVAITEGAKAEAKLSQIQSLQEEKSRLRQELLELHKSNQSYIQMTEAYAVQRQVFLEAEKCFKASRSCYELLEERFRKGQAGLLAELLVSGEPCPVCGACEHPRKTQKEEGMPSEAQLKEAQMQKEADDQRYQEAMGELGQLKNRLEDLAKNVIDVQAKKLEAVLGEDYMALESKEAQQNCIVACGSELRAAIEQLGMQKVKEMQCLEKGQEASSQKTLCEVRIKEKERDLEKVQESITQLTSELARVGQIVQQIEEELPEALRVGDALAQKIAMLEGQLEQALKALEALGSREVQIRETWAAAQKDVQNKKEEQEAATKRYTTSLAELEGLLGRYEFVNYEAYKEAYRPESEIRELEERIQAYAQQLVTLEALSEQAVANAQGLMRVDLLQLEEASRVLEQEVQALSQMINQLSARVSHNKEQLGHIEVTRQKIRGKEEEYGIVAELENVAYGDTANKKRMTFESYVLTAYFDEIIEAANHRLEKMSSGRFELRRKEELAKGRGKQGLELEVLDYHTGKARDVKTLSGGEGFKASLALALGLADVIQSHAGGISIETMFVDEGFGTLDAASLDSAIECLLGLQQGGRLIGIISHVAELRERVEVALQVSAGQKGSKAEFIL